MEFYNIGDKSIRLSSIILIEDTDSMNCVLFTEKREIKCPFPKKTMIKILENNIQEKGQHFAG